MKKYLILICLIFILYSLLNIHIIHCAENKIGYILLQVEENGEAYYIYPQDGKKYYLGRPNDAFVLMKKLSLGAKHNFINNSEIFPERLAGMILLDVERNGEAYYIYPVNLKKYYLGRPSDAFRIMRELSVGATNEDIANFPTGDINGIENILQKNTKIKNEVPFTSQAPFGNWNDQRQQDGCEESSSLMAIKWANDETLTKEESLEKITGISDWLLEKYGEYRDISLTNTVDWIIKDYFDYSKVALKKNITINDIIYELEKGNLIITPMNGQIIRNTYYTSPGPPRHMIVITGYDAKKEIFITNDPGTRNGKNYEYDIKLFFNAIRDYPTGYHKTINNIEKNMIVVWK